jgi:hypothetical protein
MRETAPAGTAAPLWRNIDVSERLSEWRSVLALPDGLRVDAECDRRTPGALNIPTAWSGANCHNETCRITPEGPVRRRSSERASERA